jgi:hypothetical protein
MTRRRTATWHTLAYYALGGLGAAAMGAGLAVGVILAILEHAAP